MLSTPNTRSAPEVQAALILAPTVSSSHYERDISITKNHALHGVPKLVRKKKNWGQGASLPLLLSPHSAWLRIISFWNVRG